ncbi:hypothetical protein [Dyella sp. 2YAF14]|uniref:hypothetical protein n=1 Tax=Dyella sp. 2YAF14 TaxID=3233025 RepID=UPI003F8DC250
MSHADPYEVFLQTWRPSELLKFATLDSNVQDVYFKSQVLADMSGSSKVTGATNPDGPKFITPEEQEARHFHFFRDGQQAWSDEFVERLIDSGIGRDRVEQFFHLLANVWVDGKGRRQNESGMLAIKSAIQAHDRRYHRDYAGKFVINKVKNVLPMFEPHEMRAIFRTNENMLANMAHAYLTDLQGDREGSINNLTVRRGARMSVTELVRRELNYLSSYSLAITPAEQFSQNLSSGAGDDVAACVFSARLPAIQQRTVAFAPFIRGMSIEQLEVVVAPPIRPTPLRDDGRWAIFSHYSFD